MENVKNGNGGGKHRFGIILSISVISIFMLLAILFHLTGIENAIIFDPPVLLPILNLLFLFLCPMVVGYLAAKGYLASGSMSLIMLGSGVFTLALGSLIAGFLLSGKGPNAVITVHNVSVFFSGVFHLAGAIFSFVGFPQQQDALKRKTNFVIISSGIVAFLVILTFGLLQGILPIFFIQGQGPTLLRQVILGLACLSFFISGLLFMKLYHNSRSSFLYLYTTALFLISIGLGCILIQKFFGSPIGWLGRIAQYTAGLYLLAAVFSGARELGVKAIGFDKTLVKFFRNQFEALLAERTAELALANKQLRNEIAERKLAESILQERETQFRALVETTKVVAWVIDLKSLRFKYISPRIYDLTGYRAEMWKDFEFWAETLHPDDRDYSVNFCKTETAKGKDHEFDYRMITTDGRTIWIRDLVTIDREDGCPVSLRGYMIDITDRKQVEKQREKLQDQLLKTQKMEAIGTLAGGIAHQFNNALYVITGNIDFLETDYPEDKKIADYTMEMKDSTHRMAQLTSQLLAYAKGGKYQAKTISVNDFVDDTLSNIHHVINPDIEIITDLAPGILNVKADQTQMQMMLAAILTNASEAIEGDGFIRITTKDEEIDAEFAKHHPKLKTGPYVCIIVEDNGKGMDNETSSRIFEPFFSTKFEGRGLGMASVFGIVKNHDGWSSVYSEAGRGTVVNVYLPLIETQTEAPLKSKIKPIKGTGTILIIDDEEMVMKVSQALLERLGYKVLGAMTGKEAISIAQTYDGEIDLAILDMVLPDMDGKAIYPLIMEARPDLKVLVCSGYSIDGPAQKVVDAGAQGFIQKPFTKADLSEKLKEILEGKQSSSN